jgi:hypothetical protein
MSLSLNGFFWFYATIWNQNFSRKKILWKVDMKHLVVKYNILMYNITITIYEEAKRMRSSLFYRQEPEILDVPEKGEYLDFDSIWSHSRMMKDNYKDYLVDELVMKGDMRLYTGGNTFRLSEHALAQLCVRVGVPTGYIMKCVEQGKIDLAVHNLNEWISNSDRDYFIRTDRNHVRGVLSQRYSTFDIDEILASIHNTIEHSNFKIVGSMMNNERFHMRLIDKPLDIGKDELFSGIQIDSSDVGRKPLSVIFFIYRLVCTNGMTNTQVTDRIFKHRHLGIDPVNFRLEFSEAIGQLPVMTDVFSKLITDSQNKRIPFIRDDIFKQASQITGLTDEIVNKSLDKLELKYDHNRWGLINSFTETAQEYPLETRLKIETAAGKLLKAA